MLMGLSEVLALARTPEEREEMKKSILRLMEMRDEDIDFSDIPPIKDFSRFKPLKPRLDKMREHNKRLKAEREKANANNNNE
ncbi:MAG: hypothetical protein IJP48_10960 [Synergistaceae bacterium]|nr:hypothetical protein [Synergistaceae bacterium]